MGCVHSYIEEVFETSGAIRTLDNYRNGNTSSADVLVMLNKLKKSFNNDNPCFLIMFKLRV